MAKRSDNDWALLLAAGVGALGLGMLASSLQESEQRRTQFVERLAHELYNRGYNLLSATFGRAAGNVPVWSVAVESPLHGDGVRQFRVRLPDHLEPYADNAPAFVAGQIAGET